MIINKTSDPTVSLQKSTVLIGIWKSDIFKKDSQKRGTTNPDKCQTFPRQVPCKLQFLLPAWREYHMPALPLDVF